MVTISGVLSSGTRGVLLSEYSGKYCYGKTPKDTWEESIYLAKEKLLHTHSQNVVSLPMSDEVETAPYQKHPFNNNPTQQNDEGERKSPSNNFFIQKTTEAIKPLKI
ncbi:hypothetical protein H8B06_20425 [Sphingobacterium sp. DN00404]|uniref:Uncharacterized protein n=1 Tax=Sphingobacterium micropteri TaxID=2763501 RepID=A0ABR7YV84_9SPHI|nr:hypothetical protein [Sphingobacterium micropteri]MBD1435197.1 hypothetical protein [Sphingobacterium micropteri]